MHASHKHKAELKKTGTKEFALCCPFDNKLKTWQNDCVLGIWRVGTVLVSSD